MYGQPGAAGPRVPEPEWYKSTEKYEKPDVRKSVIQLIDTLIPYAAAWFCIVWMINKGFFLKMSG